MPQPDCTTDQRHLVVKSLPVASQHGVTRDNNINLGGPVCYRHFDLEKLVLMPNLALQQLVQRLQQQIMSYRS